VSLTHDDVQRLLQLLDASHFDEMRLEIGDIKLNLRRGNALPVASETAAPAPAASAPADQTPAAAAAPADGLVDIRAPLLGNFYLAPKPGAEPFVRPGAQIEEDTVIGIIEVMKLMNPVPAGLRGEIVEVRARDGQFVEYGQLLMRVRAAG